MERGFDVCSPRGGRHSRKSNWSMATIFLSTPSARRATKLDDRISALERISIHALREEDNDKKLGDYFYPRPPRGGRQHRLRHVFRAVKFLSTPSVRRATGMLCGHVMAMRISIHALREEGDALPARRRWSGSYFYPRPPRGGRPSGWKA